MTKQEIKAAVTATLQKVEPKEELPAFIKAIRYKALMLAMFNGLPTETLTAIDEACDEFGTQFNEICPYCNTERGTTCDYLEPIKSKCTCADYRHCDYYLYIQGENGDSLQLALD